MCFPAKQPTAPTNPADYPVDQSQAVVDEDVFNKVGAKGKGAQVAGDAGTANEPYPKTTTTAPSTGTRM